jgi:hypothetical protein
LTQSGHDEAGPIFCSYGVVAINAMSEITLEKYFEKIGFTGPAAATLGTLKRLQVLHATAIPFENIDPLMGRPVSLNLSALSEKTGWLLLRAKCFFPRRSTVSGLFSLRACGSGSME